MKQFTKVELREKLKKLSVPPPGIAYLLNMFGDENLSHTQLANIIQQYPTIAVKLIALANSAWSSPVNAVESLEDACARLGQKVVRSISISLAISTPFNSSRCQAFDVERYLCSSMLTAEVSGKLATLTGYIEPQIACTGGLLHNLGLLLLADLMPEATHTAIVVKQNDPDLSINEVLNHCCGIGYDEAGRLLGEALDLPSSLVNVLANHRLTKQIGENPGLVGIVNLGREMVASHYRNEFYTPQQFSMPEFDINSDDQASIFAQLENAYPRTREMVSTLTGVH